MFFMSVLDVCCLPVIALGSGIFMFTGMVFCSNPPLMYALAITAPFWWYTSTVAAVILALNRCLGIVSRDWSDKLFGGRRAWLWVLVAVAYGIHHDIYTKACIFSGVIGCWYFNPHVGYLEDVDHNYSAQDLLQHNIVVLVSLTTLYGVFVLRIAWSKQQVEGEWQGQVNVKA
ncbi:Protein SRT-59, partial [Aphelenchoides avenae]